MSDFQVDLSNCDTEPIHTPGQIQSHGFLIVIDQEGLIRFSSDNIVNFIGNSPAELLGKPLQYIESSFGNANQQGFIDQLINIGKLNKGFDQINPFQITIGGI